MDFFDVKTLEDTLSIVRHSHERNLKIEKEWVSLNDAVGRVLSQTIISPIDLPDFNRSTVDGYAVYADEVFGASDAIPSILSIAGEIYMGHADILSLNRGEAIYVPTGGALPNGADGVVMIEYCEKLDEQTLLVKHPIHVGENVTYKGDDVKSDERVLEAGRRLSAYDIGLLAGLGIATVLVYKKIKVAVLSTGDEIISVEAPAAFGKIRDINGYALCAALRSYGAEITLHKQLKDDFELLKNTFMEALEISDCVLLSGGSSVGARDYTCDIITQFEDSALLVHGIAVKPGKPTIVGRVGEKLVFGLPGHPSAALLLYNLVVLPYFETLVHSKMQPISVTAVLSTRVHGAPGRDAFVMVDLDVQNGSGDYIAKPIHAKSGMITLLSKATGYIRLSRDQEGLNEGTRVTVTLLRNEQYMRGMSI